VLWLLLGSIAQKAGPRLPSGVPHLARETNTNDRERVTLVTADRLATQEQQIRQSRSRHHSIVYQRYMRLDDMVKMQVPSSLDP
jgi:hypothetical protein